MVTHRNSRKALDNLAEALRVRSGWTLSFVGEDQPDKLAVLVEDLKRDFSDTGDGKRFVSGFAYWGVAPTVAWTKACNDTFYRVMRESIRRFSESWSLIAPQLAEQNYHYVSLGVGTGEKDHDVLGRLLQRSKETCFLPVDMSAAMLRTGVKRATDSLSIDRSRILPIELDFSRAESITELRSILDILFDDQPILFSLLGNTLANFDHDQQLLLLLAGLLHPQDRLLLELATTNNVSAASAEEAAREYARSDGFRQFALSALLHNTDLRVNRKHAGAFLGDVEDERAVRVRVLYRNTDTSDQAFTLPDGIDVEFRPNDTIRLYLSRKYSKVGIHDLVNSAKLRVIGEQNLSLSMHAGSDVQFGVSLMLLESPAHMQSNGTGWDVFIAYASPDADIAEELYNALSSDCRVYFAKRTTLPGDNWDRLGKIQGASLITLVLISANTDAAHNQREEIQAAVQMARSDQHAHRVIPIYLDGQPTDPRDVPYGLWIKHALEWTKDDGWQAIAAQVLSLVAKMKLSSQSTWRQPPVFTP